MNVQPIKMDEYDARRAYVEYRQALAANKDRNWAEAAEYETIAAGYRAISRGKRVVDLPGAFRAAGVDEKHQPRLAIAGATWRRVTLNTEEGRDWNESRHWAFWERYPARNASLNRRVTIPQGAIDRDIRAGSISALVPIVPAPLRPAKGLENYHILFEPKWEPVAPVDPMLLRHLSGHLWVIVAHWDLTEVERAVLSGRLR